MGQRCQDPNDYYDAYDLGLLDEAARHDTGSCPGTCHPMCRWCAATHECPVDCGGGDACPYVALDAADRGLMKVAALMSPPVEVTRVELVALVGQADGLAPGARIALSAEFASRGWRWRRYDGQGVPAGAVAVDHGRWRANYVPLVPEVRAPFEVDGEPSPF